MVVLCALCFMDLFVLRSFSSFVILTPPVELGVPVQSLLHSFDRLIRSVLLCQIAPRNDLRRVSLGTIVFRCSSPALLRSINAIGTSLLVCSTECFPRRVLLSFDRLRSVNAIGNSSFLICSTECPRRVSWELALFPVQCSCTPSIGQCDRNLLLLVNPRLSYILRLTVSGPVTG